MFATILKFELKYRFKRPATYIYFFLCFFYVFLIGTVGTNLPYSEKVLLNSPRMVSSFFSFMSIFGLILGSAVMGMPVYRDIEHQSGNYLFTSPISEKSYLGGRFLGSFLTLVFIFSGMILGLFIGTAVIHWFQLQNVGRTGAFNFIYTINPFLMIVIPNLFFSGALFFGLVALTKKVSVTYVVSILLFIAYLVGDYLLRDLDNRTLVDLLDPFAVNTYESSVKYYSIEEQNTKLMSLSGLILWNRVVWLGVGTILLAFTFIRFNFQQFLSKSERVKVSKVEVVGQENYSAEIPKVAVSLNRKSNLKKTIHLASLEFRNIIRDPYFLAILLGGLVLLFVDQFLMYGPRGSENLPLTLYMLEAEEFDFFLFAFILITFYTGEVIHRDKAMRFSPISDTLPVPNWLVYSSKLLGLLGIAFLLAMCPIITGIINQAIKGFYFFEFGLYIQYALFIIFPNYLQYLALAFFVHIIANNKFAGHGITMGIWFVLFGLSVFFDYDYNLFKYGYEPSWKYSDLNGFGHFVEPLFWFNFYWLALGIVFLLLGNLLWNRGLVESVKTRMKVAYKRLNPLNATALTIFTLLWLGAGVYIYYNISIINTYLSEKELNKLAADYEQKYKKHEFLQQPKVVDLSLHVDIYPEERKVEYRGKFWLKNKSQSTIDSLHLEWIERSEILSLLLNGKEVEPAIDDQLHRHRIYPLQNRMYPGDSILMEVEMRYGYNGFANTGHGLEGLESYNLVTYNGSFLNFQLYPGIGYSISRELESDLERKKQGLPDKLYRSPEIDHPYYKHQLLFLDDADLVTSEIFISTIPGQVAVAPGYLQKEWEENGRRYFHYKAESKGHMFFSFVSGKYNVVEDVHRPSGQPNNEVKIQIFHHPTHTYNLDYFMSGVKDALDYFTTNFSPYQHRHLRILEFPRYADFAQSFDGTVPFSENFGWVNNYRKKDKANITYYVTAHEVAHQWWGHQLYGRQTRGSNIMSESLADYSSAVVLEMGKGKEQYRSLVRHALDAYLTGRSKESKHENIWLESENQQYLDYNKGLIVLNSFRSYYGEEKLNNALRSFIQAYRFQEDGPFISTNEFYDFLKLAAVDSLAYLLDDHCKNIILYENRLIDAGYEKLAENEYKIKIKMSAQKLKADGLGKEESIPMNDLIEVGVFGDGTEGEWRPLKLEKKWVSNGVQEIEIFVDTEEKPVRVIIDPYHLLIDKNPDDNIRKL